MPVGEAMSQCCRAEGKGRRLTGPFRLRGVDPGVIRAALDDNIARLDERLGAVRKRELQVTRVNLGQASTGSKVETNLELAKEDETVIERDGAVHGRDVLRRHVDVAHNGAGWAAREGKEAGQPQDEKVSGRFSHPRSSARRS